MKRKWFSGLAISMGIAAFPGISEAQYSGVGGGLGASSFQLPPPPPGRPAVAPTAYRQNGPASVGSGVPVQSGYQDPYSLGAPQEYETIPAAPPIYSQPAQPQPPMQSVHPSQRPHHAQPPVPAPIPRATPNYAEPHQHAAPAYQPSPSHAPCPSCAAGSCAAHGVGPYYADQTYAPGPYIRC